MFVQRIAGPSRLSASFTSNHVHSLHSAYGLMSARKMIIGRRQMSRKSGNRPQTALVDPKQAGEPGQNLEQMKEQGEQAERMGNRGMQRRTIDEEDLPTMDVYMAPKLSENSKELYFPYYPWLSPPDWPLFVRMEGNWIDRTFSRELWKARIRTAVTPWTWHPIQRTKAIYEGLVRLFRFIGITRIQLWMLNPIKWRTTLFTIQKAVAKAIVDTEKLGPKAKQLYLKKLDNHRSNLKAMLLIASKQRFPEYVFPYNGTAERNILSLDRYKQRRQRLEENRILSDLSSKDSPLHSILVDAAEQYKEMNKAISRGDNSVLPLYAGKTYLREIRRRCDNMEKETRSNSKRKWEFMYWINPPVCLSIRSNDFLSGFNRSLVMGERLYVNMLVKFESMQSLTIEDASKPGKLRPTRTSNRKTIKAPVTEYLILDVRTWVPGRRPKFIQEVFEGQELDVVESKMTEEMLGIKKKEEVKEEVAAEATTAANSANVMA